MQSILADLTDDCSWSCRWVLMLEPQHVICRFERGIRSAYKPQLTYKFWLLFHQPERARHSLGGSGAKCSRSTFLWSGCPGLHPTAAFKSLTSHCSPLAMMCNLWQHRLCSVALSVVFIVFLISLHPFNAGPLMWWWWRLVMMQQHGNYGSKGTATVVVRAYGDRNNDVMATKMMVWQWCNNQHWW